MINEQNIVSMKNLNGLHNKHSTKIYPIVTLMIQHIHLPKYRCKIHVENLMEFIHEKKRRHTEIRNYDKEV